MMNKIRFWFDYYVIYHVYNERKLWQYDRWMSIKWGNKYKGDEYE